MEQVAARQRIKVATKEHILITALHLSLHPKVIALEAFVLLLLGFVATVAFGITAVEIAEEVVQGIMIVVMVVMMIAARMVLRRQANGTSHSKTKDKSSHQGTYTNLDVTS